MFQVNAITRLIEIPNSVTIKLEKNGIAISGPLGDLFQSIDSTHVQVGVEANQLFVKAINSTKYAKSIVGTLKALISNMIKGVTEGFEKKLLIVGVGFKAQANGDKLNLNLGYSHPIVYSVPGGIKIDTPTATEITIKGIDKQSVGQVAAEVRAFRRPEPYKGKGIRYSNEKVAIKETKKK